MYHPTVGDSELVFLRSDETLWNIDGNRAILTDSGVQKYVSDSVYFYNNRLDYTAIYKDSDGEDANIVDLTQSLDENRAQTKTLHNVEDTNGLYVLYKNGDLMRPDSADPLISKVKQWKTLTGWRSYPEGLEQVTVTAALTETGELSAKWKDCPDSAFQKVDTGVTSLEDNFYWKDQSVHVLNLTAETDENGHLSSYSFSDMAIVLDELQ